MFKIIISYIFRIIALSALCFVLLLYILNLMYPPPKFPSPHELEEYVPHNVEKYYDYLEDYFGRSLPDTRATPFYVVPTVEDTERICGIQDAIACHWSTHKIVMSEPYKHDCWTVVHELVHAALQETGYSNKKNGEHDHDLFAKNDLIIYTFCVITNYKEKNI
jgi:hypothetical protein